MRRNSNNRQSLAILALVGSALSIGASGTLVRLAETGPTATAFWRGALALPFLALWAWLDRRSAHTTRASDAVAANPPEPEDVRAATRARRRFLRVTFWAGFFFAGDLLFWHWSLMLTSVAASTLEANLAPIVVTAIVWIVWKHRPRPLFLLALGIALVGLYLMVSPKLDRGEGSLLGDALGVVTAMFYGAYLVAISRLRSDYGTGTVMFGSTVVFTLLLLPIALTQIFLPQTAYGWAIVGGLALASQVAGQSLVAYALAHLPATLGSLGLYLQPLAAAFYAWIILGETLSGVQIAGALLILFALALARRSATHLPT